MHAAPRAGLILGSKMTEVLAMANNERLPADFRRQCLAALEASMQVGLQLLAAEDALDAVLAVSVVHTR